VLGRSQSGVYPFHYADARPGQVKAMIDIEGAAPALNCPYPPTCQTFSGDPSTLTPVWGVTTAPITYSPAVTDPSQLVRVPNNKPAGPNEATCWRQGSPVHTLPNLQNIPTMIMVSQSSFAAQTEACMHQYLEQAGVKNDFVRLEKEGLYGNGHLMNVELNSDHIAEFLIRWLRRHSL